jgi:hypothetical protein
MSLALNRLKVGSTFNHNRFERTMLTISSSLHKVRQVQIVVCCMQQLTLEQTRDHLLVELPLVIRKPHLQISRAQQPLRVCRQYWLFLCKGNF